MLTEMHQVLREVIYAGAGFNSDDVDVCFELPTRDWIDRLTRPTINMMPVDFSENLELGRQNFKYNRDDRHVYQVFPPRRIDVRYMATVLTTEIEDEHELVWRTLAALLRTPEIPEEMLPEHIRALKTPVVLTTARGVDDFKLLDVWNNLGVEPHAAFNCVLTLPMDPEQMSKSPMVLTRTNYYKRLPNRDLVNTRTTIGGVVRDVNGQPISGAQVMLEGSGRQAVVTDTQGRFVLRDVQPGSVGLQVARSGEANGRHLEVEVPSGWHEADDGGHAPYDLRVE